MRASKARVGPARGAKKKGRSNQRSNIDRGKVKSSSTVAHSSASLTKRRKSRSKEDDLGQDGSNTSNNNNNYYYNYNCNNNNNNNNGNHRQPPASQLGLQISVSADADEGSSASNGSSHRRRQFSTSSVRGWTSEVSDTVDERLRHPVVRFSLGFALAIVVGVCVHYTVWFCTATVLDGSLSMHALLPASKVFAAAVGFTVFVVWVNFGPGSGHVRKQTRSPPSSPMASSSLVPVSVTEPSQSNETSQDAASNNSSAAVSSNPAKKSKNSAPATQSSTGCLQTTQSPRSLQQSCASAEPSLVIASSKVDLVAGPSDSNSKQQISNAQHEITDPSNSGNIEDDESDEDAPAFSEQYYGFVTCTPSSSYGFIRCSNKRAFDSDVFFHMSSVVGPPTAQQQGESGSDPGLDPSNAPSSSSGVADAHRSWSVAAPGDRVSFNVERPRWNSRVLAVNVRVLSSADDALKELTEEATASSLTPKSTRPKRLQIGPRGSAGGRRFSRYTDPSSPFRHGARTTDIRYSEQHVRDEPASSVNDNPILSLPNGRSTTTIYDEVFENDDMDDASSVEGSSTGASSFGGHSLGGRSFGDSSVGAHSMSTSSRGRNRRRRWRPAALGPSSGDDMRWERCAPHMPLEHRDQHQHAHAGGQGYWLQPSHDRRECHNSHSLREPPGFHSSGVEHPPDNLMYNQASTQLGHSSRRHGASRTQIDPARVSKQWSKKRASHGRNTSHRQNCPSQHFHGGAPPGSYSWPQDESEGPPGFTSGESSPENHTRFTNEYGHGPSRDWPSQYPASPRIRRGNSGGSVRSVSSSGTASTRSTGGSRRSRHSRRPFGEGFKRERSDHLMMVKEGGRGADPVSWTGPSRNRDGGDHDSVSESGNHPQTQSKFFRKFSYEHAPS